MGKILWRSGLGNTFFYFSISCTNGTATYHLVVKRSPWYLLISDGVLTQAYGVKTGANSFCSWQISPDALELFLDTNSGGSGVLLENEHCTLLILLQLKASMVKMHGIRISVFAK